MPVSRHSLKIRMQFARDAFTVDLVDQPAVHELLAMLPLRLEATDFASAEKIAYLPSKLHLGHAHAGTSAEAGDFAYYAPWGNVALFYKDAPYAPGLVRLGRVAGPLGLLGRQPDGVVSIERMDE